MIDKSNWTPANLNWLAGLLEGEGCFAVRMDRRKTPYCPSLRVRCVMSDEDVMEKLVKLAGFGSLRPTWKREGHKDLWSWDGCGSSLVKEFEIVLYPFLGIRRQKQILDSWRIRRDYELNVTPRGNFRRIFTTTDGGLLPLPASILL